MRKLCELFFLIIFFLTSSSLALAEWAKVKYVIDGDTIILENNQRVRLVGIDTPEVKSEYKSKTEYYGEEAKQFLRRLVEGKRIWLQGEESQSEYDKYGRRLAYLFLEDKTLVNRELVRLGYAEAIQYFSYKYKKEFKLLEKEAHSQLLGMWGKGR